MMTADERNKLAEELKDAFDNYASATGCGYCCDGREMDAAETKFLQLLDSLRKGEAV